MADHSETYIEDRNAKESFYAQLAANVIIVALFVVGGDAKSSSERMTVFIFASVVAFVLLLWSLAKAHRVYTCTDDSGLALGLASGGAAWLIVLCWHVFGTIM